MKHIYLSDNYQAQIVYHLIKTNDFTFAANTKTIDPHNTASLSETSCVFSQLFSIDASLIIYILDS